MSDKPNVLLIMADQWRGDCLSIDGHPVVHTPTLDGLAQRGVRFSRAYSATPTCVPARASLYTGLSPRTHGFVGFNHSTPWPYQTTIASAFTEAGYQTQAVGKMHVYPERSQMGFQNVILHSALGITRQAKQNGLAEEDVDDYLPWLRQRLGDPHATGHDHGVDSNSNVARPWDKDESLHYTNFVAQQSIDFLRRRDPRKPFFLFMSFNAPHPPYDPPAWAFEQYLHREMPDPPVGDWFDDIADHDRPHQDTAPVSRIPPHRLQRARAGYYGHMTHIDAQIGRFLEALRTRGCADNTIICFLSDHGEMMGDHHCFRKSLPYEGSARVPMILTAPGSGIRGGTVSDAVVEMRDVMPTLLEAAGVPVPDAVEGQSFLPQARGERSDHWRPYLHGEHPALGHCIHWITDGHDKYIWFSGSGREQLFNLDDDPQELHDLARDADADITARLNHWRNCLIHELTGREEGHTDGQTLITGRPFNACLRHLREQT